MRVCERWANREGGREMRERKKVTERGRYNGGRKGERVTEREGERVREREGKTKR